MIRTGLALLLLLGPVGLWSCASSSDEPDDSEILLQSRILFRNFSGAYANQDTQAIGAIKNDFRRLNAQAGGVLIATLQSSKQEDDQGYAAFALGFSDSRQAVGPLASATNHRNETVRGNAIVALGYLAFPDLPTEPFIRLMKDPLPQIRQAALFGLAFMPFDKDSRGLLPDVQARLEDPEWAVRNEALIVLRKMKRPEATNSILDGPLHDKEPLVRASAALALGALGREAREASPFLIEMLKDEDHRVVDAVWTALNRIHDKDFDRSYATWRDWYEDEQKIHYSCPEHKEISETAPGKCPKCGRKLERMNRDVFRRVEPSPASPSGLFTCTEHPDILTTTPARCGVPGCGRDLVPKRPDPVIYACPDHPMNVTTTPAKCGVPGCGKDLLPRKP
ncbi:MAG TPA: HEAT repeat domain-containing protein [Planctomycetota bacterium]|nr:HEAT repeat domain-containing protein [Planctomycetota bacterium]